jgi:hypothetical protein
VRASAVTQLVVMSALAGCLQQVEFPCASDADCVRRGEEGVCGGTGYCSFVDASCQSGARFGALSGVFAERCVPTCDAEHEPTLVGCWELEGHFEDASGDANHATGTDATFGDGRAGLAVELSAQSHVAVADSVSLSPQTITIEAWVSPGMLPAAGQRMGIFDNNGQYGLFLQADGVSCSMTVGLATSIVPAPGEWTHIACTYDGLRATIYVDGSVAATAMGGMALGIGTTDGSAIGGNSPSGDTLVGKLDQLRVWNVARTPTQICAAAGHRLCL